MHLYAYYIVETCKIAKKAVPLQQIFLTQHFRMITFTEQHTVAPHETAAEMGSGLLPVYATPSVVALMEHTACELIATCKTLEQGAIPPGATTVGTHMAIDHVKACLPGEQVTSTATLLAVEGRQYQFKVEVTNATGELLAEANHTRFLVYSERFMAKL